MACSKPSVVSTKETTNYARLCRLLIEVGSEALREIFDKIHRPGSLHTALMNHKATLQSLRSRNILNPIQWGVLYPAIPSSVSAKNFDITLLVILLRNMCGLSPPATGWDAYPPEADNSCQADIVRLRHFRNTIYGHAERASVDDKTFKDHWRDIRDVLLRLGGACFGVAITQLETECMDPCIEEHFKDLLEQWRKDENNIKDQLLEIQREVRNFSKILDDLRETVSSKGEDNDQ